MNCKKCGTDYPHTIEFFNKYKYKGEYRPTGECKSCKKKRDKEMHKMFRIPEYSFISGEVKGVEIDTLKTGDTHPEQFVFDMTIIGTAKEIAAMATNWRCVVLGVERTSSSAQGSFICCLNRASAQVPSGRMNHRD